MEDDRKPKLEIMKIRPDAPIEPDRVSTDMRLVVAITILELLHLRLYAVKPRKGVKESPQGIQDRLHSLADFAGYARCLLFAHAREAPYGPGEEEDLLRVQDTVVGMIEALKEKVADPKIRKARERSAEPWFPPIDRPAPVDGRP